MYFIKNNGAPESRALIPKPSVPGSSSLSLSKLEGGGKLGTLIKRSLPGGERAGTSLLVRHQAGLTGLTLEFIFYLMIFLFT